MEGLISFRSGIDIYSNWQQKEHKRTRELINRLVTLSVTFASICNTFEEIDTSLTTEIQMIIEQQKSNENFYEVYDAISQFISTQKQAAGASQKQLIHLMQFENQIGFLLLDFENTNPYSRVHAA